MPGAMMAQNPRARVLLMGDDPRLPKMPEKPTTSWISSATALARRRTCCKERAACGQGGVAGKDGARVPAARHLDDGVHPRRPRGYWGAQLVEPYVDEEVTWAIRAHQALRFYPDDSVGYEYPASYR